MNSAKSKSDKNMFGLIIEGICGSGKSSLLHEIVNSESFTSRSFYSSIILTEHQTQRVLERQEAESELTTATNVALMEQHVNYLESLHERLKQMPWLSKGRTNMCIPYLFERFHLTHSCHYKHMEWNNVIDIDSRLSRLNCKLCLLTIDESDLEQRIIESRDLNWRKYLSRYGQNDSQILEYYFKQQQEMLSLATKTTLDTIILNTSNTSIEDTCTQAMLFWGDFN